MLSPTCEKKLAKPLYVLDIIASGPKFTRILLFNAGGNIVDNAVYCLSVSPSIPEIFALKVHACTRAQTL